MPVNHPEMYEVWRHRKKHTIYLVLRVLEVPGVGGEVRYRSLYYDDGSWASPWGRALGHFIQSHEFYGLDVQNKERAAALGAVTDAAMEMVRRTVKQFEEVKPACPATGKVHEVVDGMCIGCGMLGGFT